MKKTTLRLDLRQPKKIKRKQEDNQRDNTEQREGLIEEKWKKD